MNVVRTVSLAAVTAVLLAATAAAESSSSGSLVFVVGDGAAGARREIAVVDPDGTGMRKLTRHPVSGISPRWTSDGKRILFMVDDVLTDVTSWWQTTPDGRTQQRLSVYEGGTPSPSGRSVARVTKRGNAIDILASSGRRIHTLPTRLRRGERFYGPLVWSPDGRWLAAIASDESHERVFVLSTSGSARAHSVGSGVPLAWSRRGSMLAVAVGRDLYVVNADGRDRRRVARGYGAVSWAPDGRRLAYVGPRGGIYVTRGGRSRRIARSAWRVAWSPTGRLIAYADKNGIYVVRPDGSRKARVAVANEASTPSWSPDERRLTYSVGTDIFVMRANGKGSRRIRETADYSPRWSPDGSRIAFARGPIRHGDVTSPEIYLMSKTGANVKRLASGEDPTWSPDAKTIALVQRSPAARGRPPTARIVLADPARSRTTLLGNGEEPSWSPSGNAIAFMRYRLALDANGIYVVRHSELFTARPDGSDVRLLASSSLVDGGGTVHYSDPTWSPDGSRIALSSDFAGEGGSLGIALVRVATGETRYLDSDEGTGVPPTQLAWSPDGTQIAFVLPFRLGVMRADGTERRAVIATTGDDESWFSSPRWSPEGDRIAFLEGGFGVGGRGSDVYVVNRDGTGRERITKSPSSKWSLDWSPR